MPILDVIIDPTGAVSGGKEVEKAVHGMTQKTNQFQTTLSSLKKMMATVFTAYAIKNVAQSFLDTATEMENYRVRLRAVIKDQSEADKVFGKMVTWAAEAPITTAEAIGAFVQMKAAAVANAEEATLAVANLASVMNRDMRDVAASMISGETEALRRLGVIVQRNGKEAVVQSGQFRRVVKDDMAAIRSAIIEITQLNYPNALAMRADTFSGVTETILGQLELIRMEVMGTAGSGGPFAELLSMLKRIRDEFTKWMGSNDYQTFIQKVQKAVIDALKSIESLGNTIGSVFRVAAENVDKVASGLKALVAYKITGAFAALFGISNPVALGITATGAALVYLADQYPVADDALSKAASKMKTLEEESKALQMELRNALNLGNVSYAEKIASELSGVQSRMAALRTETTALKEEALALSVAAQLAAYDTAAVFRQSGSNIKGSGKSNELAPIKKSSNKSAAELLVENIQNKMKYLFADGKAFLPILDAWAAKLKPLSQDWRVIVDLQREIKSEAARKVADETAIAIKANEVATAYATQLAASKGVGTELERQQVMLDAAKGYMDNAAWGNAQGLLDNNEYLEMMVKNLATLKAGLAAIGVDPNNWRNWPPEIRAAYEALQQFASKLAGTSMDALNMQFEKGSITAEQYRAGLEGLKTQFSGFPMVVSDIDLKIRGLDNSIGLATKNLALFVREAEVALTDKLASVPDELSGAFAGAIAYSNDLGEALQQLARDIAYAFLKAVLLKSIFGFLGIGGSSVGSGLSGGVSNVWGSGGSTGSLSRGLSAPSSGASSATQTRTGNDIYNITMNVNAIDSQSFQKALESQKATISSVVVQNIRSNGAVRKAIQGA